MFILNPYTRVNKPFIIKVKTDNAGTSASNQFTLPVASSGAITPNINVKTSDGQSFYNVTSNLTITFPTSGIYTIQISGIYPNPFFNNVGDKLKLIEVLQWGSIKWRSFTYAFFGCENLTMGNVVDVPDFSEFTNILTDGFWSAFQDCRALAYINRFEEWYNPNAKVYVGAFRNTPFNQSLNNLGFSGNNLNNTFRENTHFNQDVSLLDVSAVASMVGLFQGATAFNQDLSAWASKIGNVTNMQNILSGATAFNQDMSSWVQYMNLNVSLSGFLTGKTPSTYNYQYVDNFLIAMASRSWAGRTQGKAMSFGSAQRSSASNSAYSALVADGWTITINATVLP